MHRGEHEPILTRDLFEAVQAKTAANAVARQFPADKFYDLMAVGRNAGAAEAHAHEEHFDQFFDRLPKEFFFERELLRSRMWRSPDRWELRSAGRVSQGRL